MLSTRGRVRRRIFGISSREVTFERRGFPPAARHKQERLERIGREFLTGYHAAVEEDIDVDLEQRLQGVDAAFRGFAYEGAAMALTLREALSFGRSRRLARFLAGAADPHIYTAHVGVGWARARLPRMLRPRLDTLDPVLRWLVIDGHGFHEGYFHPRRTILGRRVPAGFCGYERRGFDQGLGRCLWFYAGADPERVSATVRSFRPARRGDLWSGVGLAVEYAGGVDARETALLANLAEGHRPHLAQGAAFGAKAHHRAGTSPEGLRLAAEMICGMSVEAAAATCDEALVGLPPDTEVPAYEVWRTRVREAMARPGAPAGVPDGELP